MRIVISSLDDMTFLSVKAKKRILSSASDAFDISSRKNISLFLYNELMISFIMRLTSATNCCLDALARNSFIWATLSPSKLICSSSRCMTSSSVREPSRLLPMSMSTVPGGSTSISSSALNEPSSGCQTLDARHELNTHQNLHLPMSVKPHITITKSRLLPISSYLTKQKSKHNKLGSEITKNLINRSSYPIYRWDFVVAFIYPLPFNSI